MVNNENWVETTLRNIILVVRCIDGWSVEEGECECVRPRVRVIRNEQTKIAAESTVVGGFYCPWGSFIGKAVLIGVTVLFGV